MTVAALVAAVASGGIVLPHLLALQRAEPATACLLWAAALGLRALVVVGTVAGALVLLHPGHLLRAFAEWPCAPHHQVAGHAAAALGGLALAASLLWALARVAQAALAVRRLVRTPLGRGPEGSVIVGGDDVVLAAAGLARPTLVVSAGALARLDDAELAAAIAHERAHIRRRHRYVLLYAELCRVLGRPLPGTARAVRQLRFHIERDADRSAVRERADRLALASAICKAATGATTRAGMAALGGDGTAARVRELLQDVGVGGGARGLRALAVAVTTVAVAAALSLPPSSAGSAIRSCSAAGGSRPRCACGRRCAYGVIEGKRASRRSPRTGHRPLLSLGDAVNAPQGQKRQRDESARRPPAPPLHRHRDDRPVRRRGRVLLVLGDQRGDGRVVLRPAREHRRGPVDAHPPQRVPVLLVVVDEQARPRVGADVVQALQPRGRLRLGVDRRPQPVALQGEAAGDDVRATVGPHRGQVADARVGHQRAAARLVHQRWRAASSA